MSESPYVGRFAPSPSGDLHFGSVVTAIAGFLQAKQHNGRWHLRIDDLDPPRTMPGAADTIRHTLERLGLQWDGEVVYQSTRTAAYRDARNAMEKRSLLYRCTCSRRTLGPGPYPGTCARHPIPPGPPAAWRVRVAGTEVHIEDPLQGPQQWALAELCGDFVVWRVEDLAAYHLAAVVDDAALGVTQILRGADLLDSAPRQIYLQRLLGLPTPSYVHLPIAISPAGQKLSKQSCAPAVSNRNPGAVVCAALRWLGQAVPPEADAAPAALILEEAARTWSLSAVPDQLALPAPVGWG